MADNKFMDGVRVEQFIKSNNEHINDTIDGLNKTINSSVKSLLSNQQTQIKSLSSIDKYTKSMDKNIKDILSNQRTIIKALTGRKYKNNDKISKSVIDSIVKPKKDTFKRDKTNYDKKNNYLLSQMLERMDNSSDKKKKGFGLLGLLGKGGMLLAGGGLIGYLLTGRKQALTSVAKGVAHVVDVIGKVIKLLKSIDGILPKISKNFKSFIDSVKSFKNIFKGGKEISILPKIGTNIASFMTSIGSVLKMFKRFGFSKGMGVLGRRAGKTLTKSFSKEGLKKIPGIGQVLSLVFGIQRFSKGDIVGGLLEFASGAAAFIPGIGTAVSLAIDLYNLKRDLTISPQELKDQANVVKHPIKSVSTLVRGSKNSQSRKAQEKIKPKFNAALNRLQSQATKDERSKFKEWRAKNGFGAYDNGSLSGADRDALYIEAVDAYLHSLGKGGGGFNISDTILKQKNTINSSEFNNAIDPADVQKDDNFSKSSITGYLASKLWNLPNRKYVKLNPVYKPNMLGVNNKMSSKFYSMAKDFNKDTGGYLLVNSAKRSGGVSVHNKGYAIDVNAVGPDGKRYGDGYIPEKYLEKYGFHRPLLKYKSWYGGPKDEGWHIEPFPGENIYGGKRNTLAPGQPYRKGVLLAGGDAYAHETGGGGLSDNDPNLPQGTITKGDKNSPIHVKLSPEDINSLATALSEQIKQLKPKKNEKITVMSNNANPRSNL